MARIAGCVTVTAPLARVRGMLDAIGGGEVSELGPDAAFGRQGGAAFLDDDVAVVVDGAIFNAEGLPAAADDAARFAALYRVSGMRGALERINGDFAVALYDRRQRTLWLARDRFGLRPLYYARVQDGLCFASRMRSLLVLSEVDRTPLPSFVARFAASHYRTFDNDPHASPYVGIAQLPGGCLLRLADHEARLETWWQLHEEADFDDDEEVLATRYRELLLDAVSRRVRRAGRPAFTLSGGMDSSTVLASAVRASGDRQHAFSTVYEDATYDESTEIASMLESSVEEWHAVAVGDPDLVSTVDRMIACNDEPVATATWLSHYVLCETVGSQGFESIFGGLGGDELNAGEYEYFVPFFADILTQKRSIDTEVERWIEYHDHPIWRKSQAGLRDALSRLVDLSTPGRCLPDRTRLLRYTDTLSSDFYDLSSFEPIMDRIFSSYLKNRSWHDIHRETAPCCIRAAERQASAFGLEVYWPFFDHRLVEFMFRIPSHLKIRDGVTKHLLRLATRGLLPEETRSRIKKVGWNAPAHIWFSGAGADVIRDLIASTSFRQRGIYDVPRVAALLTEHEDVIANGRVAENHMMFFWQLLNLERWLQWTQSQPRATFPG